MPGRFVERFFVPGTAPRVRITQRVLTGGTFLDTTVSPRYDPVYPNGESCEGVCQGQEVLLAF